MTALSSATLEQLLSKERHCAEHLLSLMEQEYKLLCDGEIDQLQALVDSKNQSLLALQTASQKREALLTENNCETSLEAMRTLITGFENTHNLEELLNQLTQIAQKCQHVNNLSGRLVRQRQTQNHNALQILQGQTGLPTDTYTQKGTTDAASQQRTLGKA